MPFRRKKKLGLALGSGAARGLAHIGVLKVLDEAGFRPDFIAGTSIGALIGAFYAAGISPAEIEQVARDVDWRRMASLVDLTFPTSGLIDGKKVGRFIDEILPAATFEELQIPLAVLTTDVETGEMLVIRKGDLHEALRAAISFPGLFTPVRHGERFLVDGGLCNPVPVDVVRDMGADIVIGVCAIPEVKKRPSQTSFPPHKPEPSVSGIRQLFDAERVEQIFRDLWPGDSPPPKKSAPRTIRKPPGIFTVFAQSIAIMENEINALRLEKNAIDLLIRPPLGEITLLEFHRAAEAISAGEEATRAVLPKIAQLAGKR